MTDSMNFGPEWLRNLSSEGSTGGGTGGGTRYQLAEYRYGREEMLALFEKGLRAPSSLCGFTPLYSEQALPPLALSPPTDEDRSWQARTIPAVGNSARGRGGSLERGGRVSRGRGSYQPYGRNSSYESGGGWGNGEQPDWSPRKEYNARSSMVDNWRRNRSGEEDDGWRSNQSRGPGEKWTRSTSWRESDNNDERSGPPERGNRGWHENARGQMRRTWDDDHLPEWATENLTEGGGTFDSTGAFHGSDDEQIEGKGTNRKEALLQKSASQQNITNRTQPPPLPSSKSAMSLSKPKLEDDQKNEESRNRSHEESDDRSRGSSSKMKENADDDRQQMKTEELQGQAHEPIKSNNSSDNNTKMMTQILHGGATNGFIQNAGTPVNRVEEDFDRLQEDLVLKLVVDEEPPKAPMSNFDLSGVPPPATLPPPNLVPPPVQDKWYYQDPQGDMQGPFAPSEMAEWFRAGYFTNSLMVRRHCDDRFWMLGDLVTMCGGGNPFQSNMRVPTATFKADAPQMPEQADMLHYHQMLQAGLAMRQAAPRTEAWGTLNALQQREILSQQMLSHPQMNSDMPFIQKPTTNPLLHMISQMQQTNKMPGAGLPDKLPNALPQQLDPIQALVHQMGGLQSLQNRLPTSLQPTGMPPSLSDNLAGLQSSAMPIPNMPAGLGGGMLPGNLPPRSAPLNSVDALSNNPENDPIKSLLRQLQSKQHQQPTSQVDPLWSQNQFNAQQQTQPHWQKQPDISMSTWDRTASVVNPQTVPHLNANLQEPPKPVIPEIDEPIKPKEKEQQVKKDELQQATTAIKEQKKKKELEEKQAKKEAEEKRKQEQKKQENEKKAVEEKRRREEERIRRELEKAKKEAEEKRMRELEEKRRLKEQRKAEEEARKKSEEFKKLEDEEKARREAREREEQSRRQAEMARQAQDHSARVSKVAPWSQSGASQGASLAEIQKAEREKRAEQAALLQQQQRALQLQEQQQVTEKATNLQLKWANKPMEVRKVKSLAEIQAEEQERLAKQAAEARLAQKEKEKEIAPLPVSGSIWSGQNLTWANTPSSQWSSNNNSGGLWDEGAPPQKSPNKPSAVFKSSSTSAVNTTLKQQIQQKHSSKSKTKKEEQQVLRVFNNGPATDEFSNWCIKALSNISTVDVPTFVSFLRDIESAYDVREYCKEYLGESAATQQFATQFLEKRRSYKPKVSAHQDDMCSPAPAITPSTNQHSTDFQEVKGKNKKGKKNKMQKVDSRILGFNVTAAQDRINVGARDYGDN